jgi:8-oxo-dGTP pyrophosphatase MutT (NUDIX family)
MVTSKRILSHKQILRTQLFSVVETRLMSKGKVRTHYNINRKSVVCIFPLSSADEIYLISQYRYLHGEVFLEEVAGHIDASESPLSAAKRELKEETGITARFWKQFAKTVSSSSVVKNSLYFFLAKDLDFGKQQLEDDEEITLVKMPLSQAADKVLRGEIKNTSAAFGILKLAMLKQHETL